MRWFIAFSALVLMPGCRRVTSPPAFALGPVPASPPFLTHQSRPLTPEGEFAGLTDVTFIVKGSPGGNVETLEIHDGRITLTNKRPAFKRNASFSEAEKKKLAALLWKTDFSNLVGDYQHRANVRNEKLIFTVAVPGGWVTFQLSTFGKSPSTISYPQAPSAYYQVTAYLRTLRSLKFPSQAQPLNRSTP